MARARGKRHPSVDVQPVERPRYALAVEGDLATISVEAPTWAALLEGAVLAASDAVRPLGCFDVWTARRVTARGATPTAVVAQWVAAVVSDHESSGFLPALVEVDRAEPTRAHAILRGGVAPESAGAPERHVLEVAAGSVAVEEGRDGTPWRARFALRLAP